MEKSAEIFINTPSEHNGYLLIKQLILMKYIHTALIIGQFLSKLYPESIRIMSETSISAFLSNQHRIKYDLDTNMLSNCNLNEHEINNLKCRRTSSVKYITDDYIFYNIELINKIVSKPKNLLPLVTFTITTCKRFDLFEKTMNSFINCCTDIDRIDNWICVDDNSSNEDKTKMKERYPFFTFHFKNISEKGHPQSMNYIRKHTTTPYIFHMEDDWKFFHKSNFISQCIDVLINDDKIGQCLINKNYAETLHDDSIIGGYPGKTKKGTKFYIHEHTHNEESKQEFIKKYGNQRNCAYWPHFSFRPSLLKKEILDTIGPYNEQVSHFEMEYSNRYKNKGFKSAFLDGIFCLHTGRLTSQRNDKNIPNAYDLNNESQFSNKEKQDDNIETYVINLEERKDRLIQFNKNSNIKYKVFNAINGTKLKPNEHLQQLFLGNDYNMRVGIVGCALSHIKLLINLLKSDNDIFCILEDDITFAHNFEHKLKHIIKTSTSGWDLIYLGHHLYPKYKINDCYNKEILPILHKTSVTESLKVSMGGTYGYLITKNGIKKLLDYINSTGITKGIDTIQQNAINTMETYYCHPHIVFSECVLPGKKSNSDIQYNYDSVSMTNYNCTHNSVNKLKINGIYNIDNAIQYKITKKFNYTNNWFDRNIYISMKLLQKIFTNKTIKILEIGTHEGKSAVWMLENLCRADNSTLTSIDPYNVSDKTSPLNNETYNLFINNIQLCTQYSKFNQYIDYSNNVMPKLIQENKTYDLIYIDGSHIYEDSLDDMNHAHHLLQKDGIMLLDDVGYDYTKSTSVNGALKTFLNNHKDTYKILLQEWQWMIQKII